MRDRFIGQWMPITGWTLVSLLLSFALLGHDFLMAGGAHHASAMALPVEDTTLTSGSSHLVSEMWGDGALASDAVGGGCGFFEVVPTLNDVSGPIAQQGEITSAFLDDEETTLLIKRTEEPTAPPGVRRALLQVFLI